MSTGDSRAQALALRTAELATAAATAVGRAVRWVRDVVGQAGRVGLPLQKEPSSEQAVNAPPDAPSADKAASKKAAAKKAPSKKAAAKKAAAKKAPAKKAAAKKAAAKKTSAAKKPPQEAKQPQPAQPRRVNQPKAAKKQAGPAARRTRKDSA